ncbi:hypothetical protein EWH99_07245 [Sporolactobacillus sp. THM7-7]|nr:hypothetical protein EWH99_07245 [Sporolactobacillus sp. THM7-7]
MGYFKKSDKDDMRTVIGHPSGSMDVESVVEVKENSTYFKWLAVFRTARRIMDGYVYVKIANILKR